MVISLNGQFLFITQIQGLVNIFPAAFGRQGFADAAAVSPSRIMSLAGAVLA